MIGGSVIGGVSSSGALCVSHSDFAKDKNRYVVKIILHLKRSLGRIDAPERAFAYHRQHLGISN